MHRRRPEGGSPISLSALSKRKNEPTATAVGPRQSATQVNTGIITCNRNRRAKAGVPTPPDYCAAAIEMVLLRTLLDSCDS